MENKVLLLFFLLVEAVILAFCETDSFDSFGPPLNEQTDSLYADLSKRKDFYLFEPNNSVPEVKNVAKRPAHFNDHFSHPTDSVNSVEIRHDVTKANFSEKENEMSEFHQDGHSNWQQEKHKPFHLNKQGNYQEPFTGHTFNRRITPHLHNHWEKNGNIFQNSQSEWNEEKDIRQYETVDYRNGERYDGRIAFIPNMGKPSMYSDIRNAHAYGKSWSNNRETNGYFQPKTDFSEKKTSLTLFNDDMKSTNNYDHESVKYGFKNLANSKMNYYYDRNGDNFRNFHNPEKGVVINFNTDCTTNKPNNPIFHKFIFASKPRNSQTGIPTFQIPETTVITRQMSTPIYYL